MGITVFLAPQRQATLMTLKTVNRILTLFVVFRDLKHLPIRGFCSYLGNYLSYNVEIWYGGCPSHAPAERPGMRPSGRLWGLFLG